MRIHVSLLNMMYVYFMIDKNTPAFYNETKMKNGG